MGCELEPDAGRYLGVLSRAFDRHYAEGSDVWTDDLAMRASPPIVQGRLKLPRATRVLDVGCGAGRDTLWFAGAFAEAVGIDLHAHAEWEEIGRRAPNVRFLREGLLEHEPERPYGLVFDNGCFHHQHPDHYGAYLARAAHVLADGGTFVLSTFKNPELRERVDDNGRLHRYFTDEELHGVLDAAGFTVFHELDLYRVRPRDFYRLTFARAARA